MKIETLFGKANTCFGTSAHGVIICGRLNKDGLRWYGWTWWCDGVGRNRRDRPRIGWRGSWRWSRRRWRGSQRWRRRRWRGVAGAGLAAEAAAGAGGGGFGWDVGEVYW
jgi:hypothetical protein